MPWPLAATFVQRKPGPAAGIGAAWWALVALWPLLHALAVLWPLDAIGRRWWAWWAYRPPGPLTVEHTGPLPRQFAGFTGP